MFFHKNGIDERFLFGCISIQFPADIFHPIQDMPSLPLVRPFEQHVFHEMGQAKFVFGLIACPDIDSKTAIGYRRCRREMNEPETVG